MTTISLLLFAGLLLIAAVLDILRLMIPNWISLGLLGGFGLYALGAGMDGGMIGNHALTAAVTFVFGIALVIAGIWGGGDGKMLAAVSLWVGYPAMLQFLYVMALAGGAVALTVLVIRRVSPVSSHSPAASFLTLVRTPGEGIPYGVAISVAGLYWASTIAV